MASSSNISLPREKCMKCREQGDIILSTSCRSGVHQYCQSCFRKENITNTADNKLKCPCCHALCYENVHLIDEAILIGEAATLSKHISPRLKSESDTIISPANVMFINEMNKVIIDKFEAALLLSPSNFYTLNSVFLCCCNGLQFLTYHKLDENASDFYRFKIYDYAFKLLDHSDIEQYESIKVDCCAELSGVFDEHRNYPAALKYSKLAYELCLRSSDHTSLSGYKDLYLKFRADVAKLPPLRFAVGDEVEFLHELEAGSEWKLGRVVELYYRERDFDMHFTAPYRLQLLEGDERETSVCAWVKADIDRYVRKVGVRSIEDTRYQTRLDAKVAELARVFCSSEFIQDIYISLAEDQDFAEMLQSVWQVELSEDTLSYYRTLVVNRQPLVRTDSGYHLPSPEEVIAGIRAYFDPVHLSGDTVPSAANNESHWLRDLVLRSLQGRNNTGKTGVKVSFGVQPHLLRSSLYYSLLSLQYSSGYAAGLCDESDVAALLEMSDAVSKVSSVQELTRMLSEAAKLSMLEHYLEAWIGVHTCLENPDAESACECPFIYFFVKFCLEHNLGVPKLALAVYDRMNMQLSREFIRCANPTCELNKLDQSTGQLKFKKCSRCQAVIYCSRECQVAHYPEHKRLCTERATEKGHNSEGISYMPPTGA